MKPSLRAADSLFKPWFVPCHDTREGSGMDMVKVRHVKQTAPGTYEFREDGADSPILGLVHDSVINVSGIITAGLASIF
ncbi:hypothetical protein WDV76_11790 [Xenorhabdus griffiniae]|uniref:hypothetical protein n=1 Tax=Xenorhabdus griffiniae TaxID=351672 RepID=UPI0030CF515A